MHRETRLTTSTSTFRASTRSQWVAVAFTLLACAFLALGLPRLAEATKPQDTALTAGERVAAGGVSIVPGEGWSLVAGSPLLTISKESGKLNIFPPADNPATAEDDVKAAAAGFTEATVSDITTFTTDSGLAGAMATAEDGQVVNVLIAYDDGSRVARGLLFIDPAAWQDQQADIEAMFETVDFTPEAGS